MEGRRDSSVEYSRRLPPPEAWKKPDKYIDLSTGLPIREVPRLVLPTDDREFVKPDESIELVLDYFFWSDYDWPYSQNDPETALDAHHFQHRKAAYHPDMFDGDMLPSKFREIPTLIGLFPRQFHNVFHDFTAEPKVPEYDAMSDYYQAYQLAVRAFSRLITSAKGVSTASRMFSLRSDSLQNDSLSPKDKSDQIAQEMMRDLFNRHFTEYGRAIEEVTKLKEGVFPVPVPDEIMYQKPHVVAKKRIGSFASRAYVTLPQATAA